VNRLKNLLRAYSPITADDSLSLPDSSRTADVRLSRLSHALIAKSIIEALFVTGLAVYFAYTNFHPYFRGSLDHVDERVVTGWVVNEAAPDERVEVYLYINGHFVSRRSANSPRADVLAAGRSSDAYHGFVFATPTLPPNRTYEARVYAVHITNDDRRRTLHEIGGGARRFSVTANQENAFTPEVWWESERQP
jgi:hypothetical protein